MESRDSFLKAPTLGNDDTDPKLVEEFYMYWDNFVTCQNFAWADVWDEREGENRREKRFIQKTNLVERKKAKRTYMNLLSKLVNFVKSLDQRYQKLMQIYKEEKIRKQKEEEELQIKKEQEWQKKKEELLKAELEQYQQDLADRGESQSSYEEYIDDQVFACKLCRKEFKSEPQLLNHNQSKQHLKNKKKMMKEVGLDLDEEIDQIKNEKNPANQPNKKKKKKKNKQPMTFAEAAEEKSKHSEPEKVEDIEEIK